MTRARSSRSAVIVTVKGAPVLAPRPSRGHGMFAAYFGPGIAMRCQMLMLFVVPILLAGGSSVARAQWELFSDQSQLRGKTVLDVGQVTMEAAYDDSTHDARNWVEFRGSQTVCLPAFSVKVSGSIAPAMLLRDTDGVVYIAVFSPGIASLGIEVKRATTVRCRY